MVFIHKLTLEHACYASVALLTIFAIIFVSTARTGLYEDIENCCTKIECARANAVLRYAIEDATLSPVNLFIGSIVLSAFAIFAFVGYARAWRDYNWNKTRTRVVIFVTNVLAQTLSLVAAGLVAGGPWSAGCDNPKDNTGSSVIWLELNFFAILTLYMTYLTCLTLFMFKGKQECNVTPTHFINHSFDREELVDEGYETNTTNSERE